MIEKISSEIQKKIIENLKPPFHPFILRDEFEGQFNAFSKKISQEVATLRIEYDMKLTSDDDDEFMSLVKITREDFINNYRLYYDLANKSEKERGEKYDELISSRFVNNDTNRIIHYWICEFEEYLFQNREDVFDFPENRAFSELILNMEYYDFKLTPDAIIKKAKEEYLSKIEKYWSLLEASIKYLNLEDDTSFTDWIVNVGFRDHYFNNGNLENSFTILNDDKEYTFVQTRDCKKIKDLIVNIYLESNNEILKISIGSGKLLQRTSFNIAKEVRRIDITEGNVIEIYLHHQFNFEAIVFDTDRDAYKFQAKLSSQRNI